MGWLERLLSGGKNVKARPVDDLHQRVAEPNPYDYVSLSATLLDRREQVNAMLEGLRERVTAAGDRKLLVFARGGREDCLPFLFTRLDAVELRSNFPDLMFHRLAEIEVDWRGTPAAIVDRILADFLTDLRFNGMLGPTSGLENLQQPAIAHLRFFHKDWKKLDVTRLAMAELVRRFADLRLDGGGLFFLMICLEGKAPRDGTCDMGDFALTLADQHPNSRWMLVLEPAPLIDIDHVGPWAEKMVKLLGEPTGGVRHKLKQLEQRMVGSTPLIPLQGVPLATLAPHVEEHVETIVKKLREWA